MEQKRSEMMEGPYYVTLLREGGGELECEVMASFVTEEGNYIVLIPVLDEKGDTVYLYRFTQGEDDSVVIQNIEEDDEYQRAAAVFEEIFYSPEEDIP